MRLDDVTWQAGENGEVDAFIHPNGADWDWLMAVPAHPESDRGDILAAFSSGLVIGGTSGVELSTLPGLQDTRPWVRDALTQGVERVRLKVGDHAA